MVEALFLHPAEFPGVWMVGGLDGLLLLLKGRTIVSENF